MDAVEFIVYRENNGKIQNDAVEHIQIKRKLSNINNDRSPIFLVVP